ncbi:MAG: YitT family protein [Firmicutes bacterium]|nr:YitT family protein [Bacillota bacterium]
MRILWEHLGIALGVSLTALGLVWFLIPNKLAAGGVSGLAIMAFYLWGWPVGLTMISLNVPLFLVSWLVIGPLFGLKTLFGAGVLSLMVELMGVWLGPATSDPVLAAIYGGGLAGLGTGITFYFGGSTGGTDMAAHLLSHWSRLSLGQALLVIDFSIIALAGVLFSPELALYALLSLLISSRAIDLVQEGTDYARAAYIISDCPEEVARAILDKMERGVTILHATGAYTGRERKVLFVIVSRAEIARVKELVADLDPKAFIAITDVHEVLGEGFKARGDKR